MKYLLFTVILLAGCTESEAYKEMERRQVGAYYAPFRKCSELGGIPRPGTSDGYSRRDIYGGCDFPDRSPK